MEHRGIIEIKGIKFRLKMMAYSKYITKILELSKEGKQNTIDLDYYCFCGQRKFTDFEDFLDWIDDLKAEELAQLKITATETLNQLIPPIEDNVEEEEGDKKKESST